MHPDFVKSVERKFRIKSKLGRCLLAEFLCTAFLLYAGFNCSAQYLLSEGKHGNYLALSIGWGLSLMFAVTFGFNISEMPTASCPNLAFLVIGISSICIYISDLAFLGSHCNCSVSFFLFTLGELPFLHFIYYSIAQFAGAFLGTALTYIQYYDQINAFDGGIRAVRGPTATASIFATYPHDNLTFTGAFIDQVLCTAFLCIVIGAITDPKNKIPRTAQPPLFGAMITLLTIGYGMNAGNAMNPARDLGPRLFSFCVGYGAEVFSHFNYAWWIIPVVCPFIGAVIGTWIYRICFGANIDPLADDERDIGLSVISSPDPTKIWPPTQAPANFIVDFSKNGKNNNAGVLP